MTYEDAVYFKLVLLCGYKDELQAYVDKALIEQDPLSDVVLKLSAVGADDKKMLSVLNEYLRQIKDSDIDYNKSVLNGNILVVKKILVALAGPITNLMIICMFMNFKSSISLNVWIVYANLLLILFNLIPLYPLDGGKIFKGILHMFLGKKKSERYTNLSSFIILPHNNKFVN